MYPPVSVAVKHMEHLSTATRLSVYPTNGTCSISAARFFAIVRQCSKRNDWREQEKPPLPSPDVPELWPPQSREYGSIQQRGRRQARRLPQSEELSVRWEKKEESG